MVKIVNREVAGLPVIPWANGKPTVILAHETANESNNGSYEGEISFMASNYKKAFYHMIAGENDVALLHDPEKGGAWGAGPSMHGYAIHIELVRSSTKEGFQKAYKNYIGAIKHYANKYGIPVVVNKGNRKKGIFTHHYVTKTWGGTTHTDPDAYFNKYGVSINQFAKDLGDSKGATELGGSNGSNEWKKVSGDWVGKTLLVGQYGEPVEQMQQLLADNNPSFYPNKGEKNHGVDSYYGNDTKDAVTRYQEYYGLGVDGLAGKEVYNHVTGGKASIKIETKPKGDMNTNSIIDYLKSVGESGSQANRKKLAKEYGVAGYDLSGKKNTELLNAMRSGKKKSSGQKKGTVHLPKSAKTWKTYKLNVQPVSKNSDWSLTPSAFGGITYDILGEPYPNVFTVNTGRGKRNVFAGPSTSAVVKK